MAKEFFHKIKLFFFPLKENSYYPLFLKSRFLFYYAVFLLVLKLIILPFIFYFPETSFFADLTKITLIGFANNDRENYGFKTLREDPLLAQAARLKAQDMLEKGYFDHYSPEGISPWYWLQKTGYKYSVAGENLAIGFFDSEQVHQAWMNSSSHKRNILNPGYEEIGIAVVKGDFQGKETTLVVQFFGTKREVIFEEKPESLLVLEEESIGPEIAEDIEEDLISEEGYLEARVAAAGPVFYLFEFMLSDYYNLVQFIIYTSLIFIIVILLITVYYDVFIYRKFKIDYIDAIFKTVGFSALWFILIYLDKLIMLEIISQEFMIK